MPERLTGRVVSLRVLETHVTIAVPTEDWVEFLVRLWHPFVASGPLPSSLALEVHQVGERWHLAVPGTRTSHMRDPWEVANAIRFAVLQEALRAPRGFVGLHAAVVGRDGRAVVMPGSPGAGKTTLAIALAQAGWQLCSDDFAPIQKETGAIVPFPKPLGVKDPARWEQLGHLWGELGWLPRPERGFLLPATVFPLSGEDPLSPALLVFPRFDPGAPAAETEPLSAAEAVTLLGNYVRRLGPEEMSILARLASDSTAFSLLYRSSEEAVAAMIGLEETFLRKNH